MIKKNHIQILVVLAILLAGIAVFGGDYFSTPQKNTIGTITKTSPTIEYDKYETEYYSMSYPSNWFERQLEGDFNQQSEKIFNSTNIIDLNDSEYFSQIIATHEVLNSNEEANTYLEKSQEAYDKLSSDRRLPTKFYNPKFSETDTTSSFSFESLLIESESNIDNKNRPRYQKSFTIVQDNILLNIVFSHSADSVEQRDLLINKYGPVFEFVIDSVEFK